MKKTLLIGITIFITIIGCADKNGKAQKNIQDEILKNSESFFYIDFKNYPVNNSKLPIGIFDSGTGGLTVLDAILNSDNFDNKTHFPQKGGDNKIDFANESFIYLGDKANMPYGEYAGNNNTALLKEHIIKDAQFLLGNKYYPSQTANNYRTDKLPVKAIVIACNTATAYGKNDIIKFIKKTGLDLKVIGVIGAGVRGALENISENENAVIGIMATAGAVASNGYPNTVVEQVKKNNYTGKIITFQQAGIGLAAAIDGEKDYIDKTLTGIRKNYRGPSFTNKNAIINKSVLNRYNFDFSENQILFKGKKNDPDIIQLNSVKNYIKYHVISLLEKIKESGTSYKLKSIILGCTHYPFFTKDFKNVLDFAYRYKENGKFVYRKFMAEEVALIDPAINTAKELYFYLKEKNMFNNGTLSNSSFYISVPNLFNNNVKLKDSLNFTYEYKYGRKAGEIQQYVRRVPFSRKVLSKDLLKRLEVQIPLTYKLIDGYIKE
jgi:glutamate racemase